MPAESPRVSSDRVTPRAADGELRADRETAPPLATALNADAYRSNPPVAPVSDRELAELRPGKLVDPWHFEAPRDELDDGPTAPVTPRSALLVAEALADSEALTPRGGFGPPAGVVSPPTHAVVVPVGDAPASEEIPMRRSSIPPPRDPRAKETLRAVPRPTPKPPPAIGSIPSVAEQEFFSSDAPVVTEDDDLASAGPESSVRPRRTLWAVVLAATAAGLVLLAIAATRQRHADTATAGNPELPAEPYVSPAPRLELAASPPPVLGASLDSPAPSAEVASTPPSEVPLPEGSADSAQPPSDQTPLEPSGEVEAAASAVAPVAASARPSSRPSRPVAAPKRPSSSTGKQLWIAPR